ncbi:hypothetical protein [Bacillus sp. 1P02SD]|uniref:hypothetical protein n=1 Tax=Bacillus sp. 1P02SD TaxID=3132264 RepID=UPI0039A31B36
MNNVTEIIDTITLVLAAWFALQFTISLVTLLLGSVMVDYVELGIFRNTNNPFLKFFTFVTLFIFGLGPFIYTKLSKYSWIVRKLLMLVITLGMGIVFMIIYYIIKALLHAIFL